MKRSMCILMLCLVGMMSQAWGQHKALTSKETARIMALEYKNFQHVKTYLCSDMESVKAGDVVKVGLLFQIEEGWNIYDNDTLAHGYLPTQVQWIVPDGCHVVGVVWQTPVKLFENESKMGYFHYCFVVVTIRVEKAPATAFEVKTEYEWQMCDDRQCIHRKGSSSIPLKVGTSKRTGLYGMLKKWK